MPEYNEEYIDKLLDEIGGQVTSFNSGVTEEETCQSHDNQLVMMVNGWISILRDAGVDVDFVTALT